jgi:molybdate transport system regulatory protein
MKTRTTRPTLHPRFRILCGRHIALGPGKAELLAWVGKTGSINQAAKQMGMSYMRAWSLIQAMHKCFKQPVIETARGGPGGGGAALTKTGRKVLTLYRQMERASLRATAGPWKRLQRLLSV